MAASLRAGAGELRRHVRSRVSDLVTSHPPGPKAVVLRSIVHGRPGPLAFFSRLAETWGDVVFFRIGSLPCYVLYHPEDVGRVLVEEHRAFIKDAVTRRLGLVLGEGLLTSEGETWRRQRRLASPSLTPRHVAAYADTMVARTVAALDGWADGEVRDVHADMMSLTLEIVLATLFGAEGGSELRRVPALVDTAMLEFERRMGGWRRLLPFWLPSRGMWRVQRATRELDAILLRIVRARRASGHEGQDLLWRLLGATDEEGRRMDDRALRDESLTLFLAGHETTALALSYALHLLSVHGEAVGRLRDEIVAVLGSRAPTLEDLPRLVYADAVVKETLRLFPPAWSIGREAIADVEVAGYLVRAGAQVVIPQWVIHRDPRWFEDPGVFTPERWLGGRADALPRFCYLPFGGGPRVCIGNHFATMEAVLCLVTILQRFAVFPVAGFRLELAPSVTLRPRHGVRLRVTRREGFR
jgi:cytochrome P450